MSEPTDYDVKQLLVETGIRFRDRGPYFSVKCPYHDDSAPSAAIYKSNKFFVCFSCGERRGFRSFYKDLKGKSWDSGGVPDLKLPRKEVLSASQRAQVGIEDGIITSVYDSSKALAYCRSRGIKDDFLVDFDVKASEIMKVNGKVWSHRLLTPVLENGKLYSLEGRDYTRQQKAKCLYPFESPIDIPFNVDNLSMTKPLIVVEGLMDVHPIYSNFTKNVTATFGIMIPMKQQEFFSRHKDIILFIDDDKAGHKSIQIFEKFMHSDFRVAVVKGTDPGGANLKQIEQALENAVPFGRYVIEKLNMFPKETHTLRREGVTEKLLLPKRLVR